MHPRRLASRARHAVASFACACALACLSLPALAGIEHPADAAAVNAVHLDIALLKKVAAVTAELKSAPKSVQDQMDDESEMQKDDKGTLRAPPVSTLLPKLERHPEFRAALAKNGLDGRQYLLAAYALANGGFAAAFTKPGTEPAAADFAKWGVNPAHYRFCRDHMAEVKKLMSSH